jgi:ArsR family transcriptional regulator, arsenate/arsenite/antimonite-responsive transcriptional repressor
VTEKALKRYERRAEVFKALSHPVRILILDKLKERNWCVCELAEAIGVEKSLVSKHLSQLREVGLIEDRKRGTCVEYHLMAPGILDAAFAADEVITANRRKRIEEAQE